MEVKKFKVQGSQKDPYIVKFLNKENVISVTCTCAAGKNGKYCKHQISIIEGIELNIINSNSTDIKTIRTWVQNSPILQAFNTVRKLEIELLKIKKDLSIAKNNLSKTMRN